MQSVNFFSMVVIGLIGELLLCFSLYTNGYKLLSTKQPPGSLTSINGIRFLSMSWVILGHTFYFSVASVGMYVGVNGCKNRNCQCLLVLTLQCYLAVNQLSTFSHSVLDQGGFNQYSIDNHS